MPGATSRHSGVDRVDRVLIALVCVLALAHAFWFDHTADDAYISFRYVDNWVRGYGPVFNPGERVMGYSNFLWVVVLYPFGLAGAPVHVAARALGVLLAFGTLIRVYTFAAAELGGRLPALGATALLASFGTFALWMLGGLEGQLLGLLLTIGVVGALQTNDETPRSRFIWLGIVFGLASITHPEPVLYVAPVALWLWLQKRTRGRAVDVAAFVSVAAAFVLSLCLAAWLYYGDPLPNTFYAKTQPISAALLERGVRMTRKFVLDYRWLPAGIVLAWLVAVRSSRRARGWLPLAVIATFVAFFLGVGGDMLQYHRMWVPVLPMFALLFAEALGKIPRPAFQIGIAVVAIALVLPNSFWGRNIASLRQGDAFLAGAQLVGERLDTLPPDTVVAANNVGVIGYVSDVRILDMMGLNDRHIARAPGKEIGIPGHEAHDGGYVLDQRPDIIILSMPRAVETPNPAWDVGQQGYPSDTDLRRDPRFAEGYELQYLRLSDGRWSPMHVRRGQELDDVWTP